MADKPYFSRRTYASQATILILTSQDKRLKKYNKSWHVELKQMQTDMKPFNVSRARS